MTRSRAFLTFTSHLCFPHIFLGVSIHDDEDDATSHIGHGPVIYAQVA